MSNVLNIRIYKKGDSGLGVVFWVHGFRLRYRITTVVDGRAFIEEMRAFCDDLDRGRSNPQFLYKIVCPRGRHRYLEILREQDVAVLSIYELIAGEMKLCFCWKGSDADFKQCFRTLRLLLFLRGMG